MDNMVKVSILVPVLNAIDTIKECLDSVINQSLKDIEVLCIDSGSEDGTIDILKQYQQIDNRIRIVMSDKKSYGYQLNRGIAEAQGKYIGIVESDDLVDIKMFDELFEIAEKSNFDFVKADYCEFHENSNEGYSYKKRSVLYDHDYYRRVLDSSSLPELLRSDIVAIWSGIYNKNFLIKENIAFNETPGASYQDTGFWALTQMYAKSAFYTDKAYYKYRIDNPNSSTFQSSKCFCICDEFAYICKNTKREVLITFAEKISWVFYRKYKTNLERTPTEKKELFFQRMAEDLFKFNDEYDVTGKYYYQEEWDDLKEIIQNPSDYFHRKKLEKEEFIRQIENISEIVIYGAGRIGQILAREIGINKVECFAVTESTENNNIVIDDYMIPIKRIDSINRDRSIAIASKLAQYRNDMGQRVCELGFEDVRLIPFGAFD